MECFLSGQSAQAGLLSQLLCHSGLMPPIQPRLMSGLPPACLCDVPSASEQSRPTDSAGIYLIRSILSVMHQISIPVLAFWRQWQSEMSGAVWCSLTYRWEEFRPCTVTHGFNFSHLPPFPSVELCSESVRPLLSVKAFSRVFCSPTLSRLMLRELQGMQYHSQ